MVFVVVHEFRLVKLKYYWRQEGNDENRRKTTDNSGAACGLKSAGIVEKIHSWKDFVIIKALKDPEIIGSAGTGELKIKRKIRFGTVVLSTSAGPLRWRNHECCMLCQWLQRKPLSVTKLQKAIWK
uniref:AlNc14C362G10997 protein n=1 Tax=Albugo laibachii Nc14 TaxID=890382 RepID=F0WXR1_9STRA|nr:AlNc14C362G10997 [Albugo laibachii Nc14]|eukprot:CCA26257.1 AlNc14C362G10997 [Albugo laibachii Nc14]